ncbi:hypothetical protein PHMEG_00030534 [Phytophthora megakarya]|uniref:Uncharacterized protein n=1 Tax=Phytophthora megakarya TaxID=4795 RepID=A0A225UZR4_9STRA|nr:hypothetical protein PHMEG_00030534 [Phytophthora megakarya]
MPCVVSGLLCVDTGVSAAEDQVAQLQAQLRDSEAAHQAAERRAEERVLDVNALVDFLMRNKPKINVMFNWMRLAALLHHFVEGTAILEGRLTNINVVALDDPRCECPEYAKPSPRPGNVQRGPFVYARPSENQRPLGILWVETEALQAKLPEPSDDEVQDPSYELSQAELNKAARAEAAADNDESSEESDKAGKESKPALTHPSPASPQESKTGKASDKGSGSKAMVHPENSSIASSPAPSLSLFRNLEALHASARCLTTSKANADNDESSEDSDNAGKESKPAATHPSPASSRESKTGKTSDKGSDSKSHGASAKLKSRVITSSKSQPIPISGGTSRARKMPVLSLATFLRRAKVEVPSDGPRRTRSKLAKLSYDDLHSRHLDMVEAACRETYVSYRIFGTLVKFDSYRQSQGCPDFEPHKPDIHILKARWDLEA